MLLFSDARKSKCGTPARLSQVLTAARRTPYYRQRCLSDLPAVDPVSLAFVRRNRELFRDPRGQAAAVQSFEHPLQPAPKSAVLEEGFRSSLTVRVSPCGWLPELAAFGPAALAAAPHSLISLAQTACRPRVRHSLVAFVGPQFGILSPEDRDLLWTSFGVPVYEQFRGLGGELLASECDAHSGMHIRGENAIFEDEGELLATSLANLGEPVLRLRTGLRARIATKLCGCGETAPRLIGLEHFEETAGMQPLKSAAVNQ